jgi:hypothetical protein
VYLAGDCVRDVAIDLESYSGLPAFELRMKAGVAPDRLGKGFGYGIHVHRGGFLDGDRIKVAGLLAGSSPQEASQLLPQLLAGGSQRAFGDSGESGEQ